MKNLITTVLVCIIALPGFSQVKLKRYADKNKKGYKSIVFEKTTGKNADGTSQKSKVEYNLEAHNPYNQLSYRVKETKPNGSKVYEFTDANRSTLVNDFGIDEESAREVAYSTNNYAVHYGGNHAIVAYRQYLNSSNGDVLEKGRRSTIRVINSDLDVVYEKSLPADAYNLNVSPDGKYIVYAYGGAMHSSYPKDFGFKIINTTNSSVFHEEKGVTTTASFKKDGYLCVSARVGRSEKLWILDLTSNELFRLDKKYIVKGRNQFKYGQELLTNLTPFKVK